MGLVGCVGIKMYQILVTQNTRKESKMESYKVILKLKCDGPPKWIKQSVEDQLKYDPADFYSEKGEHLISFCYILDLEEGK